MPAGRKKEVQELKEAKDVKGIRDFKLRMVMMRNICPLPDRK
jgi:hypothetical protein